MTENTNAARKPTLDELRAMLAQFDAAEVKTALKTVAVEKPTMLSVTMDAYLAMTANGGTTTEAVVQETTKRGHASEVLKAAETATITSVAAIMRYAVAYEAAVSRRAKTTGQTSDDAGQGDAEQTGAAAKDAAPPALPAGAVVVDGPKNKRTAA